MKKKVIAYLHTHWDREWYREFEVFRLRLLRVFDNILDMLEAGKIPSFYFDGQTAALLDYLEIRPEKEGLVRRFVAEKRLFIGPFYCLVDEFLTDRTCFEKNLEIGLKTARDFGCEDFIGYLADTFGHSQNVPKILKEYGIDKCMVWRGCPAQIPSEFTFNGINTVNMIRGYFNDIFSMPVPIEKKAQLVKENLDKIAEKSGDVLLLPIGADHLGVEPDIMQQIERVNALLDDYEITLSNPFEYFELAGERFSQFEWSEELRSNECTFILPGSYSARLYLKKYNVECSYKLAQAAGITGAAGAAGEKYKNVIEYAYKLLLQNQAHDGICGCSTDTVHRENVVRYEKVLQIAGEIIEEHNLSAVSGQPAVFESPEIDPQAQVIGRRCGFENALLHDTQRIPVTEDWKTLYLQIKPPPQPGNPPQNIDFEFVQYKDAGDSYNFGAVEGDTGKIVTPDVKIEPRGNLLYFRVDLSQTPPNSLTQIRFKLPQPVTATLSEDMNTLVERYFDPGYDIRANLPKARGLEAKTNTAPMQRFVWAQGFGVITKGLTEYEVSANSLLITLCRNFGVISNPQNPCRTTPAGPPIPVPEAQHAGSAEFAAGFFNPGDYNRYISEVFEF
jgi:hypothetical protein